MRLALPPPRPPVEQNDDGDNEQDNAEHPEGVDHLLLPSSTSPYHTNATQTAAPITITRQERTWARADRAQRAMFVDKLTDVANLAMGALVFGQALTEDGFSTQMALLGLGLWLLFIGLASYSCWRS